MAANVVKLEPGQKYENTPAGKQDFIFDHVLELVAKQEVLIMKIDYLTQEIESIKQTLAESKKLYICK